MQSVATRMWIKYLPLNDFPEKSCRHIMYSILFRVIDDKWTTMKSISSFQVSLKTFTILHPHFSVTLLEMSVKQSCIGKQDASWHPKCKKTTTKNKNKKKQKQKQNKQTKTTNKQTTTNYFQLKTTTTQNQLKTNNNNNKNVMYPRSYIADANWRPGCQ